MTYQLIFEAVGDHTRRSILESLRSGPLTVREISARMPVSRPAVSQHLKVLKEAGLVTVTPKGRSNEYAMNSDGLQQLRDWLDGMWDDALAAFKDHVEKSNH